MWLLIVVIRQRSRGKISLYLISQQTLLLFVFVPVFRSDVTAALVDVQQPESADGSLVGQGADHDGRVARALLHAAARRRRRRRRHRRAQQRRQS